ncbi:MAG: HEPN domain-containing protein [ANME-2 cluster archaeon]|nr:HEPN domain-containing protein [ANME-2 cluster archaeon]MBC2709129.1 HEPN domain-containing protein [ANME-2 cluster archaeon]MBC2746893.1 HEPN domain-containing protein [ANME-2 cluster archaeon]MBC2762753.1 HEPN domain-containing protein [ANME-2 cluster archaeon]
MKKMILKWWKQANRDLLTAKNCIGSGDYYASVFFSEQAIEKGLKALYIKLFNDAPPRIHYIDKLASLVNAPLDIMDATYELSEDYMLSRYPDVSDELPFELYDENMAKIKLVRSEEILSWVRTQMGEDNDR